MINRLACVELLDFLNSIEGHGYGGMFAFENARLHAKMAIERFDAARRQDREIPFLCPCCGARGTTDGAASTVSGDLEQ